ncbi:MAG TPA: hypothetical protein PKJ85_13325 [Nitrosomonas nitrosa]|nr:hypothetical protein [Nitrosomonas nitrosa]
MIRRLNIILLFSLFLTPEAVPDVPIVCSRCERTPSPWTFAADIVKEGQTIPIIEDFYHMDAYDVLPDITNLVNDFTDPYDLVHRDASGIIGKWKTLGSPGGKAKTRDNIKPTLHLNAVDGNNKITSLYVGIMDVGNGLDVNSLNVCLDVSGTCSNIALQVIDGDIVSINLYTPISDVNQIIKASVSDTISMPNTSSVEFTTSHLMARGTGSTQPQPGGNPDISIDEETTQTINISATSPAARVFVSGYPPGSVWNEVNRTLKLSPDFTQSGVYTVTITEIENSNQTDSTFTVTVNDTITPPTPTIIDTTPLTNSNLHVVRITTDSFLDPDGRTYDYNVMIPTNASSGNKMPVDIFLHGSGGAARVAGSSVAFGIGPYEPYVGQWIGGEHTRYPNAPTSSDTVPNTSQRRILHVLDWIVRNYPGVDLDRVNVRGDSMGGTGSIFLSLRYPYHINSVTAGLGRTDVRLSPPNMQAIEQYWGDISLELKDDKGMNIWERFSVTRALRDDPRFRDVPIQTVAGVQDTIVEFHNYSSDSPITGMSWEDASETYKTNHRIFWDQRGHSSGEGGGFVGWWHGFLPASSYYARNLAHPGFTNSSLNDSMPVWDGSAFTGNNARGAINRFLAWNSDGIVDDYDTFTIPVFVRTSNPATPFGEGYPDVGDGYTGSFPVLVDVTPRRVQKFKALPGESIDWAFGASSGTVVADASGDITVPQLQLTGTETNLVLTRSSNSLPPATVQ